MSYCEYCGRCGIDVVKDPERYGEHPICDICAEWLDAADRRVQVLEKRVEHLYNLMFAAYNLIKYKESRTEDDICLLNRMDEYMDGRWAELTGKVED